MSKAPTFATEFRIMVGLSIIMILGWYLANG